MWIHLHLIASRVLGVIVITGAPLAHVGRALVTGNASERGQEQGRKENGAPEPESCGARTRRLNHSKTLPPPLGSRPKYFLPLSSAT